MLEKSYAVEAKINDKLGEISELQSKRLELLKQISFIDKQMQIKTYELNQVKENNDN